MTKPLGYERVVPPRPDWFDRHPLVLCLAYLCAAGWSIVGAICAIAGIVSFLTRVKGLMLRGKPVETVVERCVFVVSCLTIAGVGVSWFIWRERRMAAAVSAK